MSAYSFWQGYEKKKLKKKFDALLTEIDQQGKNVLTTETQDMEQTVVQSTEIIPERTKEEEELDKNTETERLTEESVKQEKNTSQQVNEHRIAMALQRFEQEKGFLGLIEEKDGTSRSLKIEDLALKLGTNRTSLSNFLNTHKGGFNNYVAQLRITQVLLDLKRQSKLRKKSIDELSQIYGFANTRSFNKWFRYKTDLPPSYFIKELDLRTLEEQKNPLSGLQ